MESVLSFDLFQNEIDKLSENVKTKTKIIFKPFLFHDTWYTDQKENAQYIKYSADLLFSQAKYEEALLKYKSCLELIPKSNNTLKRDVNESITWCNIKLKTISTEEKKFENVCTTPEQMTSSYFLESNKHRNNFQTLKRLASLHPHSSSCLWNLTQCKQVDQVYRVIALAHCINFSMRHLGVTHGFSQTYHKKVVEDAQTTLMEIVKKKEHIKDILEAAFKSIEEVYEYKSIFDYEKVYFSKELLEKVEELLTI